MNIIMERLMRIIINILSILLLTVSALADEYPNKTVTVITPSHAGNSTDVLTRIVADGLRKKFNNPFVVLNRPGASGTLGTREVVRSTKDGYTLLISSSSLTSALASLKTIPYNVANDITPISLIAEAPMGIA